ncbi:MAG: 4-hydroxy-tetrahydrodipicolinate reductase [Clostridiales bacterium]|nr:4-hydroxy-tetrahydrodipicolinate reductase [Clostridiales bacterium]
MNIAVFGARGRIGRKVVEIATGRGHNVWKIDRDWQENALGNVDTVIDFATADATKEVCEFCKAHNSALVSGVTGRNDEQLRQIDELSAILPTVCKANFSLGVNMLYELAETAAKKLADWDCEIVEIHHRNKTDSPSGTAKQLAGIIAKEHSFKKVTVHALRAGSNHGNHTVIFAANGESLTLTHQAESRDIFARGAVLEAERLAGGASKNK